MGYGMIVLAFFVGILVMLLLITIHELGHFIVAKLSKAYVYEFAIGFGPRIFTFKGKETWVSIRIFPLGGFCSIASERVDPPSDREDEIIPKERKMEYIARWKKMFFILAGPFMNLVLALTLFTLTFAVAQVKSNDMTYFGANYNQSQLAYNLIYDQEKKDLGEKFDYVGQDYVIWGWQVKNSDTNEMIFDNIENPINGQQKINASENDKSVSFEKTVYTFIDNLNFGKEENKNAPTQFKLFYKKVDRLTGVALKEKKIKNTDWSYKYKIEDGNMIGINEKKEIFKISEEDRWKHYFVIGDSIGIAAPDRIFKNSTEAYAYGWKETFTTSVSILKSFSMLITGNFQQLAGPVGVAKQTAAMIGSPVQFILFVATLSANLFVLNLIFIPPLDGYKLVENFIEMIMRKEMNRKFKIIVNSVGAVLFLLVFVGITLKDFIM